MAKGTRLPDSTKKQVASRFHKGEDPETLAGEFNISVYSVKEYGKMFPNNPRKVKRKVMVQPKENTRVSELEKENQRLRALMEFWREAYNAVITNRE